MIFKATEASIRFAKDAIEVQNACNGIGVWGALARHMQKLHEEDPSCEVCRHPATLMFVDKLYSLASYPNLPTYPTDKRSNESIIKTVEDSRARLIEERRQNNLGTDEINAHSIGMHCIAQIIACANRPLSDYRYYTDCNRACENLAAGDDTKIVSVI